MDNNLKYIYVYIYIYIYIYISKLLYCTPENNALHQLYLNLKIHTQKLSFSLFVSAYWP